MFVDIHTLSKLIPEQLDSYLANGWFRMGQRLFTTHFLQFNRIIYSAYWLRIDLQRYDNSFHKLQQRNKKLIVKIQPFQYSAEKEQLFQTYRKSLPFSPTESLYQLLYLNEFENIFNTYEIAIYDHTRLIALGVFDLGFHSAEGIVSFYDPDYKKNSLGKYLILQKILFLKSKGFQYFYPGYFVPDYKPFNYKLDFGPNAMAYFDIINQDWQNMDSFNALTNSQLMDISLSTLQNSMRKIGFETQKFIYDFFDINMNTQYNNQHLLQIPLFLLCESILENQILIIIFDIFSSKFKLINCVYAYDIIHPENIPDHYNAHLLKPISIIAEGISIDSFIESYKSLNFVIAN